MQLYVQYYNDIYTQVKCSRLIICFVWHYYTTSICFVKKRRRMKNLRYLLIFSLLYEISLFSLFKFLDVHRILSLDHIGWATVYSTTVYPTTVYLTTVYLTTVYPTKVYPTTIYITTVYPTAVYPTTVYFTTAYFTTAYLKIADLTLKICTLLSVSFSQNI